MSDSDDKYLIGHGPDAGPTAAATLINAGQQPRISRQQ